MTNSLVISHLIVEKLMQGKTAMSSAAFFDYSQIAFSQTSLSESSGLNVHKGIKSLVLTVYTHLYQG